LVLSPTGSINLGFTTEGKLAAVLITPSLGVPNWSVIYINTAPSPHYQKLAYSVFTTSRKLRQYFIVHPIVVVNEAPLSNILNNPAATGRVSLWGIELSPLDITYEKQKAIKS
jgi:hypothetical protein